MAKKHGGSPKLGTKGHKKLTHLGKGLKNRSPAEGARGRTIHGSGMGGGHGKHGRSA